MTEYERERKTRVISLALTDSECDRLMSIAGRSGLTAARLLEYFIADLTGSEYSNGNDEQLAAEDWYERCYFGSYPKHTLLHHLLTNLCIDPKNYWHALTELHGAKVQLAQEEVSENADAEYLEELREDIDYWSNRLEEYRSEWKPDSWRETDLNAEHEKIRAWLAERETLLKGAE